MPPAPLNVVLIEPYYGGSHAVFADVLKRRSRHRFTLATLPARKWKWRMRGAGIWFARTQTAWLGGGEAAPPNVILCSDMMSVADFRALLPAAAQAIPVACYFHENQLTYPLSPTDTRDYQYGMTNISSCLAADAVWFNSGFHRDAFLTAADRLLSKMPDFVPREAIGEIQAKSAVLPPPVEVEGNTKQGRAVREAATRRPTRILWCHRWEYDKNPVPFFNALIRLDESGTPFDLVITGEAFRRAPAVFSEARIRLRAHIIQDGYLASREAYLAAVGRCDLVVSTAIQENFGIAVVEAMLCGCQPLLPDRVVYPELIPPELHTKCLYRSDNALFEALAARVRGEIRLDDSERDQLTRYLTGWCGLPQAVRAIDTATAKLAIGRR